MPALRLIVESLWSFWQRGRNVERAGYCVGVLLLASGLIHLAILITGGGSWMGPLSLRKPTTFGLSFGLTLITIVWVSSFLRLADRTRSVLLGAFTVACVMETALVSLQAWRGVPSHFNTETTFDGLVTRTLAAGGVALVLIIAILTVVAFRAQPGISASLRIAIRTGFVSLFGALVVGALMIAKGMMLVFAGNPQAAYTTGGTLKPTHAVAMHAILLVPLLAWVLSLTTWNERRQRSVVLLAVSGYATFGGTVVVGNFIGLDVSRAPALVIAIAAIGILVLTSAIAIALAGVARATSPSEVHAAGVAPGSSRSTIHHVR